MKSTIMIFFKQITFFYGFDFWLLMAKLGTKVYSNLGVVSPCGVAWSSIGSPDVKYLIKKNWLKYF